MSIKLPILNSRRLILRPISEEDESFIIDLNGDAKVMKYIITPRTKAESIADLKRYLTLPEKHQMPIGVWVGITEATNEKVGIFFFSKLAETGEIELGYRLAVQHWGRGYATEGGKCLVEYGLNDLEVTRIVAVTDPDHSASGHVLQKIGLLFQKTGTFYGSPSKYYALDLKNTYFM